MGKTMLLFDTVMSVALVGGRKVLQHNLPSLLHVLLPYPNSETLGAIDQAQFLMLLNECKEFLTKENQRTESGIF